MAGGSPERSCISCRSVRPKRELLRFVLSPSNELVLDYNFKLPGRGCYVCPDRGCVEDAVKRKAFSRAYRCDVGPVDADHLIETVLLRINKRIVSFLSLARRSRNLLLGTASVEESIYKGKAFLVILLPGLSDGAHIKWRAVTDKKGVSLRSCPEADDIVLLTGKKKVLGLTESGMANELTRELDRLSDLMNVVPLDNG